MNPKDFFEKNSLYQKSDLSKIKNQDVLDLVNFTGPIDIYCPLCNDVSIYNSIGKVKFDSARSGVHRNIEKIAKKISDIEITGNDSLFISSVPKTEFTYPDKFYLSAFHCTRNNDHIFIVFFAIQNNNLFKIGQYPSELDLIQKDFYKYDKVIDTKIVSELRTSLILNGHNFNVASLVHLRRAFEFLLEEKHQIKLKEPNWDETKYTGVRNEDKIELLKDLLPEAFLKNKSIYRILSAGIHELTEKDCKEAFDVLFPVFIMIFDEIKHKKETEQKEKEIQSKKSNLESKFKNK